MIYSSAVNGAFALGRSIKCRWINNVDQRSMSVQSASQETMLLNYWALPFRRASSPASNGCLAKRQNESENVNYFWVKEVKSLPSTFKTDTGRCGARIMCGCFLSSQSSCVIHMATIIRGLVLKINLCTDIRIKVLTANCFRIFHHYFPLFVSLNMVCCHNGTCH